MKTILVPVDFSQTSLNAAKYAVKMSSQLKADKVILFHTYGGSFQILDQGPEAVMATTKLLLENLESDLLKLKSELGALITENIEIVNEITDGFLLEDALALIQKHNVDLVIMGITGKNTIEQKLIGTNTYRLASESPCPVLIVPSKAKFEDVQHVALSLQFKVGILDQTPYVAIKEMITELDAKLTVLNVASNNHQTLPMEVQSGLSATHFMFDDVHPEIVYLGEENVVKSVVEYVANHNIQLLIAITHKVNFLQSLFKGSVTKQLTFYSKVPIMVYKANEK